MAEWQRTHTCGELRETHVWQTVTLNGWVLITRNFGNQVFADVRDRLGAGAPRVRCVADVPLALQRQAEIRVGCIEAHA